MKLIHSMLEFVQKKLVIQEPNQQGQNPREAKLHIEIVLSHGVICSAEDDEYLPTKGCLLKDNAVSSISLIGLLKCCLFFEYMKILENKKVKLVFLSTQRRRLCIMGLNVDGPSTTIERFQCRRD